MLIELYVYPPPPSFASPTLSHIFLKSSSETGGRTRSTLSYEFRFCSLQLWRTRSNSSAASSSKRRILSLAFSSRSSSLLLSSSSSIKIILVLFDRRRLSPATAAVAAIPRGIIPRCLKFSILCVLLTSPIGALLSVQSMSPSISSTESAKHVQRTLMRCLGDCMVFFNHLQREKINVMKILL